MIYYGQLVIGPAGSGKSTYCAALQEGVFKRTIQVVNLDPAAEYLPYKCAVDIRDLIQLQDVMEEFKLGPNGGLVYCMEYLLLNIDWLQEEFNHFSQDDYILFDCPGQIELYTHIDMMKKFTRVLTSLGVSISSVYLLDVNFLCDHSKYMSGLLMALSASMTLELPSFTVLSKCDLVEDKAQLKKLTKIHKLDQMELTKNSSQFDHRFQHLTDQISKLVVESGLGRLLTLDINEEDSVQNILNEIDYAIQYGENLEPDDKLYDQVESQL